MDCMHKDRILRNWVFQHHVNFLIPNFQNQIGQKINFMYHIKLSGIGVTNIQIDIPSPLPVVGTRSEKENMDFIAKMLLCQCPYCCYFKFV